MSMWNPKLYMKFKAMHFASLGNLLQLVTKKPNLRVVDLGCGTGEITCRLADSLPNSEVLGVDTSPEMLAETRAFARDGLRFEQRSIEDVVSQGTKWDLVFSKTALQWVKNHQDFFPRLIRNINKGGQLAMDIVVVNSFYHKEIMDDLARKEPFRGALQGWTLDFTLLRNRDYGAIMYDNGGTDIVVYEKVFSEVMPDVDTLYHFADSTIMSSHLQRLPEELRNDFKVQYKKMLRDKYPQNLIYLPYTRLFLAATF